MSSYDLSIVIPTYNEASNIIAIIESINSTLGDVASYEIIVVDDNSKDKTWELAEQYADKYKNITCFRRITSKGLSSAVIDGFMISRGKFISVIDADLQHDESILPKMLNYCHNGADLAIGSRYCQDGSTGEWGLIRKLISKVATKISQKIGNIYMSDPMSGFFMIRRDVFLNVVDKLNAKGYKILLDIVSQLDASKINMIEVPYTFKKRSRGESKLTPEVVFQLIDFIYLKIVGNYIPIEYVKFVTVGAIGAVVHFTILYLMHIVFDNNYQNALIIAIEFSLIINYFINNLWTFKEKTHTGLKKIIGLVKFNILSGVGGIISYYISISLFDSGVNWIFASTIGAIVASLWNYNLNKILTWDMH